MNTETYLDNLLRNIRKSKKQYVVGEHKWNTDNNPPNDKIIMIYPYMNNFPASPTLALTSIGRTGKIEYHRCYGIFNGICYEYEFWSPIPIFPSDNVYLNDSSWIRSDIRKPDEAGDYLLLTKEKSILIAIFDRKFYGEDFIFSVFIPAKNLENSLIGECVVKAEYWTKILPIPIEQ